MPAWAWLALAALASALVAIIYLRTEALLGRSGDAADTSAEAVVLPGAANASLAIDALSSSANVAPSSPSSKATPVVLTPSASRTSTTSPSSAAAAAAAAAASAEALLECSPPSSPPAFVAAYSRLKSRGLPFVDDYPTTAYAMPKQTPFENWELKVSRAISGDPSRYPVYLSWTPHGFGSNLLGHVNYILYAVFSNASVVLVSKGSPYATDRPKISNSEIQFTLNQTGLLELNTGLVDWWKRHQVKQATLQAWWEESFAYVHCDTTSLEFEKYCWGKRDCDFTPFGPLWAVGTRNYYKMTRTFLADYRKHNFSAFVYARMELTRTLMRMKTSARLELDKQVQAVTQGVNFSESVAVHIRRGDKVASGEAEATAADEFVRACIAAGAGNSQTVLLLSDDEKIAAVFQAAWIKMGGSMRTRILARTAIFRPDVSRFAVAERRKGFHWLLVDLRLMVQAAVFVGSQSSNLGTIVGALRGWNHCWNVENRGKKYMWDMKRDKLDRR